MKKLLRFLRAEEGPTAVEYAVMLALILLAVIAAVQAVGTSTSSSFSNSATSIGTSNGLELSYGRVASARVVKRYPPPSHDEERARDQKHQEHGEPNRQALLERFEVRVSQRRPPDRRS